MKVGLLLNSNNKLCAYSEIFRQILIVNDLPFILIDPNSDTLSKDISGCTHILFRHSQGDTDLKIYDVVFNIASRVYGIPCFPDYPTYWPYEDKIKEYFLLKSNDFPIVRSNVFWNYTQAGEFLSKSDFPLVAKLPKGAGSANVVIVNSAKEGEKIIKQIFSSGVKSGGLNSSSSLSSLRKKGILKYGKRLFRSLLISTGVISDKSDYPEWQIQKDAILFQKFLSGNNFDTRINIIGKRALAFRRFVRTNDFRASGSGKINMEMDKIDKRCIEIAFAVSKKLDFSTMAYDFIFDEDNNPQINEMSYCFVDRFVGKCPGYWDENLEWHSVSNWPQYYQLCDFLNIENLKTIPLDQTSK
jgi:glutathione synthase/RimK-type ligase-like ATP-grasp enzyme